MYFGPVPVSSPALDARGGPSCGLLPGGEHGWNGEKLFCYLPGAVVPAGQR